MISWTNPTSKDGTFYFNFSNKHRKQLSALEAAQFTIDYITKNYPPPYTLYLSGGVDSQAMLYAWHNSNVPYNTFSAVYGSQKFNAHDLEHLNLFSKKYNIPINYYEFDVINFLETEHDTYANLYYCGSPQFTTFMKLTELTPEGTVIMSGNYLSWAGAGTPSHNGWGLYHYGMKKRANFIPWFFMETRELAYSFDVSINVLRELHPELKDVSVDGYDPTGYEAKVRRYQYHGFPVIKQDQKYNGFERLKEFYDTNSPREPSGIDKISRLPTQNSHRNFDLLYRNKYEAKFSKYKYILSC